MSIVFTNPFELMAWRKTIRPHQVGFVPTMGALHAGHESLLQRASEENDYSVLSLFVNPTQFNDKRDFEKYPITFESDVAMAKRLGISVVFAPKYETIYSDNYRFKIIEEEFSQQLCGLSRPGHFNGVLSVVMKLLQIVQPDRAYFGEKDYQQLQLVKDLAASFFIPVKIVACPTVRESTGLAMSSRNERLSPDQRKLAAVIYQTITNSKTVAEAKSTLQQAGFDVDYVVEKYGRRFVAAKLGDVRLIDNVQI